MRRTRPTRARRAGRDGRARRGRRQRRGGWRRHGTRARTQPRAVVARQPAARLPRDRAQAQDQPDALCPVFNWTVRELFEI